MTTIWKFPLGVTEGQRIEMPKGAKFLTVQKQGAAVCLWALVDTERENEPRFIEIYGTGNPIYDNIRGERKYIGTFQASVFVWHVFERVN